MDLLAYVLALVVEENVPWIYDLGRVPVNLDRGLDVAHLSYGVLLLLEKFLSQLRLIVWLIV